MSEQAVVSNGSSAGCLLSNQELSESVTKAAQWIAPLWPIQTFAARSPWMNVEEMRFPDVASRMMSSRGVSLYPSARILEQARELGEIDDVRLHERLEVWLKSQQIDLGHEVASRYSHASLRHLGTEQEPEQTLEVDQLLRRWENHPDLRNNTQRVLPKSVVLERLGDPKPAMILDAQMIKWCKLYLGHSVAVWTLPFEKDGFYATWRRLVCHDRALPRTAKKRLAHCPSNAFDGLRFALSHLGVSSEDSTSYFEEHLLCLPGWTGMLRWKSEQAENSTTLLHEYLAIRLCTEWAITNGRFNSLEMNTSAPPIGTWVQQWLEWGDTPISEWCQMTRKEQLNRLLLAKRLDDSTKRRLWMEAWEDSYADHLKKQLMQPSRSSNVHPIAQFLFCIDVRSEPIRRHLETVGRFETFGVAGFFGLPVAIERLGDRHLHPSLPVIAKPKHLARELEAEGFSSQYMSRTKLLTSIEFAFKELKLGSVGGLLLPDAVGIWFGMYTVLRSAIPRQIRAWLQYLASLALLRPKTVMMLSSEDSEAQSGSVLQAMSLREKLEYVHTVLQSIGLTRNFAPLVVVCGHGTETTNNAYKAKLQCGACGGASGKSNAELFASLCNDPDVRQGLQTRGIPISDETVFIAAEHVTTLDELRWQTIPRFSPKAQASFDEVCEAWPDVQARVIAERLKRMPQRDLYAPDSLRAATRLAADWSEVRPEWGLARNAAMLIAPRSRSYQANLQGRVFLHSYDWKMDPTSEWLESILFGPSTVAQWINLQYFASTVAPTYYGSGSKTTMTVTSGLGVMHGNSSDLMTGLPFQSVMQSHSVPYHSPIRIMIVIEAPKERVSRILNNNQSILRKLTNGWVNLAVIDPLEGWVKLP